MTAIKYENMWKLLLEYNFEMDSNLLIDLTCAICHKVMKDCRQSLCGCRYCCRCIEDYLDGQDKKCPGLTEDCKDQLMNFSRDIQIDHVANMKVSRIMVKCPESDCQHRVELRYIGDHINSHNINCPYFEVGCDKAGLNNINIDDHLKYDGFSHCKLFMNYLQQLKNELAFIEDDSQKTTTRTENLENEIENLKRKNIYQTQVIEELQEEIRILSCELKALKKNSKNREELIQNLTHQINTKDKEMAPKLAELQKMIEKVKLNKSDQKLNEIPTKVSVTKEANVVSQLFPDLICSQQNISPFSWEIRNFSEKRRHAYMINNKSILSEPFYSNPQGYKLCLIIWPDGSSATNWTYFSVGFRLMKGEYDEYLEWPMKRTVMISLMDDKSNVYRCGNYQYDSTPTEYKCCFNRPTTRLNKNRGNTHFIEFSTLLTNHRLYRNDSIILTCSVSDE